MSGCGCVVERYHHALSGSSGDTRIVYCALHESAGEMLEALKEMVSTCTVGALAMPFAKRVLAKASGPGKEK